MYIPSTGAPVEILEPRYQKHASRINIHYSYILCGVVYVFQVYKLILIIHMTFIAIYPL